MILKSYLEKHPGIYNLHPIKCNSFIYSANGQKEEKQKEIRGYTVGPVIYQKFDFTLF